MTARETPAVLHFVQEVQRRVASGVILAEAVRTTVSASPSRANAVMDIIGSWPSSEMELRELQRQPIPTR